MENTKAEYGEDDYIKDLKLLPGEHIIKEKTFAHVKREFHMTPSSLEQMMRLTKVNSPHEIGVNGPSVASLAFDADIEAAPSPSPESPTETPNVLSTPDHLRLYEVVFGRDSLRVAIELIPSYPELARATTMRLAELQGSTYSLEREEEPGRIVHEARDKDDDIAKELTKSLGWGWPYYGSVDATPEFIRVLTAYCRRSEENHGFLSEEYTSETSGETHQMAYALDMAIDWILNRLSRNADGFLEYKSTLPNGIENQVWKDSWDAYHHADGTLANHTQGIASIEAQVTTYDALLDAAYLYENVLDDDDKAEMLRRRAEKLKEVIFKEFWTDDKGGYFVLGTDRDDDGNLRQMQIRTSNMGHVLNSRLLNGEIPYVVHMRKAVVRQLMSPEMLNVSGIRTLASDEVRFRPGAYHNGSVWLWDTHHIAKGLRHHGYRDQADDLDQRLLNVIETTKIFPEYVRGDDSYTPSINTSTIVLWDEVNQRENKLEQPPQEVQAWTVAAILAIHERLSQRKIIKNTALMRNVKKQFNRFLGEALQERRLSTQTRLAERIRRLRRVFPE